MDAVFDTNQTYFMGHNFEWEKLLANTFHCVHLCMAKSSDLTIDATIGREIGGP